jgi:hypothetical protein
MTSYRTQQSILSLASFPILLLISSSRVARLESFWEIKSVIISLGNAKGVALLLERKVIESVLGAWATIMTALLRVVLVSLVP